MASARWIRNERSDPLLVGFVVPGSEIGGDWNRLGYPPIDLSRKRSFVQNQDFTLRETSSRRADPSRQSDLAEYRQGGTSSRPKGVVVKGLILLRGTPKQVDLLSVVDAADECVAVCQYSVRRSGAMGPLANKRSSYFGAGGCQELSGVQRDQLTCIAMPLICQRRIIDKILRRAGDVPISTPVREPKCALIYADLHQSPKKICVAS